MERMSWPTAPVAPTMAIESNTDDSPRRNERFKQIGQGRDEPTADRVRSHSRRNLSIGTIPRADNERANRPPLPCSPCPQPPATPALRRGRKIFVRFSGK